MIQIVDSDAQFKRLPNESRYRIIKMIFNLQPDVSEITHRNL